MMRLFQLASLATVMLQLGTFVQANPLFDGTHNNDGSPTDICSNFRVTYPMEEGLSFADNSRHLISWQAPKGISHVNVTIVSAEQKTVAMVNIFDATKGVSGEIPISLNGQDTGDFHFHLAGIGGPACQADSATFTITRDGDEKKKQPEPKKKHENDDAKDWSHALQQLDDYVKDDDKKDDDEHKNEWFTNEDRRTKKVEHKNDEWFTNDDKRTHLNAHLNQELDQIFSQSSAQQHDDVTEWIAAELDIEPEPQHQDVAHDAFDHTNVGVWSNEEYDPIHVDVEGFQAEEHDDDATVEYIMDYSNVGQWQEEQINPGDVEGSFEHDNEGGWVEDIKKFDHTNVGQWQQEEVSEEQPGQHDNVIEWQAEEVDAHYDGDWHEDVASGDWIEETEQQDSHPNVASGEWYDESDPQSHDDQDAWIAEEVDEHGVSAQHLDSVEEAPLPSDAEFHSDEVPVGVDWQDESAAVQDIPDHTDAAPFLEAEIEALSQQSVHSDAAEGWYEEAAHPNDVSPSTGKVGTGRMPAIESTHDNDGTIPVIPAEALIAKW